MAVDVAVAAAVVAEVVKDEETVEEAIAKAPVPMASETGEMGAGVEGNQRRIAIAIAIAIVTTSSRAEAGNPIRTTNRLISFTPIIRRWKIA